ncbi:MAG: RNA polymerase sigma factor [Oscillospiraceae bacterium]|nr:RNA polymerase sigma factor [Oscillospiraceae bacterium]
MADGRVLSFQKRRSAKVNNNEITAALDALRGGDKKAFEELYNNLRVPAYTIIYRIMWDKSAAEDILQEFFIKLYFSPPEPSVKNPRAYIFRTARNLATDALRKRQKCLSLDEMEDTVPDNGLYGANDLKIAVNDALKSLPEDESQIVTLRAMGELKFREISEIMKIPLGTALWKYQKAIGKLKKILEGEDAL